MDIGSDFIISADNRCIGQFDAGIFVFCRRGFDPVFHMFHNHRDAAAYEDFRFPAVHGHHAGPGQYFGLPPGYQGIQFGLKEKGIGMACKRPAIGNTSIAIGNGHIPAVSFYIPDPWIAVAVKENMAAVIGDIMLFAPAVPVIGSTACKTFEIPVNAQVFGIAFINSHHFRFHFHLFFRHIQRFHQTFRLHELPGRTAGNDRISRRAESNLSLVHHLFQSHGHFLCIGIGQAERPGAGHRILFQPAVEDNEGGPFGSGRKATGGQNGRKCFFRGHVVQAGCHCFCQIS